MNRDPYQIAARFAAQWPKRCACGRVYEASRMPSAGAQNWSDLPLATGQKFTQGCTSDAFSTMEWRHCGCGSTITVHIEIHDLDAE